MNMANCFSAKIQTVQKKNSLSTMVLKRLDVNMPNNELYIKCNTKWIIDLNVIRKTIKT